MEEVRHKVGISVHLAVCERFVFEHQECLVAQPRRPFLEQLGVRHVAGDRHTARFRYAAQVDEQRPSAELVGKEQGRAAQAAPSDE
jgi:hypothetical protein